MPIDVEKLALLRNVASTLAERELFDVNLLLHEAGLEEVRPGSWYDDQYDVTSSDRARAVIEAIRDVPRSTIDDLAVAARDLFEAPIEVPTAAEVRPLALFASHLASQRALVGEVGKHLGEWGVSLFVAHDSIEPDQEWQVEIERALRTSDAGVVFLFPKFIESRWCDQEVGWLLGREVPCYPLKFQGEDPYGPLGKKQAFTVRDDMTAEQIADAIVDWLAGKLTLTARYNASLIEALKSSWSFKRTDTVWSRLHAVTGLGDRQVAGLFAAIRDNDQVYNASGGVAGGEMGRYKELAFKLAMKQPGYVANEALAREVAKLRGLEALLPVPPAPNATAPSWGDQSPF